MVSYCRIATAGTLLFIFTFSADAALLSRDGGTLVYDTDLDITWLADANYAKTSGHDADGLMSWSTANTWAEALVYGGYEDWRLPTTLPEPAIPAYDQTAREMGHLFYSELGGVAHQSLSGNHNSNFDLFVNIADWIYWSSTPYSQDSSNAWDFRFESTGNPYLSGLQTFNAKTFEFNAWAVRDGDVASVPLPGALGLAGFALFGLWNTRRRAA